jgi:hypothetical protein
MSLQLSRDSMFRIKLRGYNSMLMQKIHSRSQVFSRGLRTIGAKTLVLGLLIGFWGAGYAADQGDIYFEAAFGSHSKFSSRLHSEFNFGYLPIDSIGFGLSYAQYYSTVTRFKSEEGSQIGVEGRWFLEPFEVYLASGVAMKTAKTSGFFQIGVNYLYALTPAISLKVDARTCLVFPSLWAPYVSLGGRLLF